MSTLLAIELAVILVVTHKVYNGVIYVNIYIVIIISLIFLNLYIWKHANQKGWLSGLIALQIIMLIALPIIFWLFKPQYTFTQAKNEVTQNKEFLKDFKVQDKRYANIRMYNSPNLFVKYAYFIDIKNDQGVEKYIIFNPFSGEYEFFDLIK